MPWIIAMKSFFTGGWKWLAAIAACSALSWLHGCNYGTDRTHQKYASQALESANKARSASEGATAVVYVDVLMPFTNRSPSSVCGLNGSLNCSVRNSSRSAILCGQEVTHLDRPCRYQRAVHVQVVLSCQPNGVVCHGGDLDERVRD